MPFDIEKHNQDLEHAKQKAQNDITALYTALEALIERPQTPDTLEEQAHILNEIFTIIMRRNIKRDKERGYIDQDHLDLALRIQKQCNDTLKTRAAIEYMHNITKGDAHPHPLKMLNQTGEHE